MVEFWGLIYTVKNFKFYGFNGDFEISNLSLGVPEIHGQSRGVFRPRDFWKLAATGEKVSQC